MDCWWIDETPPQPGDQVWPNSVRIIIEERDIPKYYHGKKWIDAVNGVQIEGVIVEIGIETEFLGIHREAYLIVEYL